MLALETVNHSSISIFFLYFLHHWSSLFLYLYLVCILLLGFFSDQFVLYFGSCSSSNQFNGQLPLKLGNLWSPISGPSNFYKPIKQKQEIDRETRNNFIEWISMGKRVILLGVSLSYEVIRQPFYEVINKLC